MPVSYRIDGDLFYMQLVGEYELSEIRQTVEEALADPAYPSRPRFVFDVSRSEVLARRSTAEVRRAVDFFVANEGRFGGRCAIITSSQVQFGMARMASLLADLEGVEYHVCEDLAEAEAWFAGALEEADGV